MIKQFTLLCYGVIVCLVSVAQNQKTDSLFRQLATVRQDTSKVLILANLCSSYRLNNMDSSLLYGYKALDLANEIHFIRGKAIANGALGLVLREKGDLALALEFMLKALNISKENNLNAEVANNIRRIGLVYIDLQDYPKALRYIQQALKMNETIGDKRKEVSESMDLGYIYEKMNQLDSALYFEQKAYRDIEIIRDLAAQLFLNLGNIDAKKGNNGAALEHYFLGIKEGLNNNDFSIMASLYTSIATIYKEMHLTDSSIYYALKGIKYGQLASNKQGILLSSNLLSELYESTDPKAALKYYKIGAAVKDSMFGAGNIQIIQTLVSRENNRQKEAEAAKIAYQNRQRQYSLIGGLIAILIIASILYLNNRQKQKSNNILENTLSNLKSTQSQLIQSEKMASLGELTAGIAHEIQNPLNFVNNFSEVSKELIEEVKSERSKVNGERDEKLEVELLNDISQNLEKIHYHGQRADAIVKGMLQHSSTSTGKKEPTNINALADEYLRLAYHGLRAKDKDFNCQIVTEFDETIGNINIIPQDIGRVLLNLYNNAFYAAPLPPPDKIGIDAGGFSDHAYKHEPTVWVTTKKEGDKVLITVKDNGPGIPQNIVDKIFQPFFTTKPTGVGTGLGLSLSYDIIKAHGGEMKVDSREGEGAEFIIQLLLNPTNTLNHSSDHL